MNRSFRSLAPCMRAAAFGLVALALASGAAAAGDKAAYEQAASSAKAAHDSQAKQCDALKDNAKDVCVLQAKAARIRAEQTARAVYKNTDGARQKAAVEIAKAEHKVAKEKCDDLSGNPKDVCVKEADAALVAARADARASRRIGAARKNADGDKRKADYKVAKEKCEALAGDDKGACMARAKAVFGN